MAKQLNDVLSPRVMTGHDVKAKITNLVAEYRKKKKEQGKTGSSPSSWPHYDQIDKILGKAHVFPLDSRLHLIFTSMTR